MEILLRELCRLHCVPLPSEADSLLLPSHIDLVKDLATQKQNEQHQAAAVDDSDADEIEDATLESEPESEADEDLSLEMDDSRNANKVNFLLNSMEMFFFSESSLMFFVFNVIYRKTKWIWNI